MAVGNHPLLMVGNRGPFWRAAVSANVANLNAACYGNGVLLAFSYTAPDILKSTDDGATFVSPITGNGQFNAACCGQAGANYVYMATGNGSFQYSINAGTSWTTVAATGDMRACAYSPALQRFVLLVIGSNASYYTDTGIGSLNGITMPANTTWRALCWDTDGARFYAINNTGTNAAYSTNGSTFNALTTSQSGLNIKTIAAGNGLIVCPLAASRDVLISADAGGTWTIHSNVIPVTDLFANSEHSCAFSNGYFITGDQSNNVCFASTDGITWIRDDFTGTGAGRAACAADGKYFLTRDDLPYLFLG